MNVNKRFIVDEKSNPKKVIIPIEDFRKIEELLGWALDDEALHQRHEVRSDHESDKKEACPDLDSI